MPRQLSISAASKTSTARQIKESKSIQSGGQPQAGAGEVSHEMIATAAYYRAERSGFQCNDVENWIEAEKELKSKLYH